eukprot:scaffold435096_cov20-Prasinocladus_malaysianus.AAC.1
MVVAMTVRYCERAYVWVLSLALAAYGTAAYYPYYSSSATSGCPSARGRVADDCRADDPWTGMCRLSTWQAPRIVSCAWLSG